MMSNRTTRIVWLAVISAIAIVVVVAPQSSETPERAIARGIGLSDHSTVYVLEVVRLAAPDLTREEAIVLIETPHRYRLALVHRILEDASPPAWRLVQTSPEEQHLKPPEFDKPFDDYPERSSALIFRWNIHAWREQTAMPKTSISVIRPFTWINADERPRR